MTHDPRDEIPRVSDPDESETIEISIDEALADNLIDIWYQPKIDLKRKCLAGAEALMRLHHPQAGLLWPEDYVSLLDDDDLAKLVEHALAATLRNWRTFAEAGFGLRLAINVPATMLSKLPIKALIAEHCAESKNWPGLILEVTEDEIVRDIALTRKIATELKASRVEIAIDDFGAGFSSFSSLRDLPFAELKLHGSFVKNCAVDVTNAAICQTAIDLAHRFGSVVVAKGIDSIADLQALMVMGCDFGQGMLVAPPMPQDRFLEALQQHLKSPGAPRPSTDEKAERTA
jgi:EAL domain-containing protein (putative c-di-GMP-specific phosphodiesterase class I)